MSVEEHRFPRWLLHPICPDDEDGVRSAGSPHPSPELDCATVDEQQAWNLIVNRGALNADMLMDQAHTNSEFVWTFERPDPPSHAELLEAKQTLELHAAEVQSQIAVIDRELARDEG